MLKENKNALELLKKAYGINRLLLPDAIHFSVDENENCCRMVLQCLKVRSVNMQDDSAAFEGWAVAMHLSLKKPGKVILDLDEEPEHPSSYRGQGHLARFLYRALRFSEQYKEWFQLSDRLNREVQCFSEYLGKNTFTNNPPLREARVKNETEKGTATESVVETKLSMDGVLKSVLKDVYDPGSNPVYRQLPVGLFEGGTVTAENAVFTKNTSAIDLWTWKDSNFEIVELKTNNKMTGIVTEIFFYSNYWYDFFIRTGSGFHLNEGAGADENCRGYGDICRLNNRKIKKITGIFLADRDHPLPEKKEFPDILNGNGDISIEYVKGGYNKNLLFTEKKLKKSVTEFVVFMWACGLFS